MPSSVRLVALASAVVLSMIVHGVTSKSHLDPLLDDDIRMMLEEKGVSTKSLKNRAQLIARWTSLESGGATTSTSGAVNAKKPHSLLVSYCSG
jgi:hypothetical protein